MAILQVSIEAATDLFHRQFARLVLIQAEANAIAQEGTQSGHVVVSVDTAPAANLEVIHAEFLLGHPEAGLDRPTAKGHAQQPAERHTVAADDLIGQEELHLAGSHIAGDDQSLLPAWRFVGGLAPHREPFDFPDLRPFLRILDAVSLPRLPSKLWRVFHQIPHLAGLRSAARSRDFPAATSAAFDAVAANDFGGFRPDTRCGRDFRDIRLLSFGQRIEELAVVTVQLIERPCRNPDAIDQGSIDQVQGDLRLRLELDFLRDVVFLRRCASLAQASGRYSRLSRIV